jgi:hypothetical protein
MTQILNKNLNNVKQVISNDGFIDYNQVIVYKYITDLYHQPNVDIRVFTIELRNNNIIVGNSRISLFVVNGIFSGSKNTIITEAISRYL